MCSRLLLLAALAALAFSGCGMVPDVESYMDATAVLRHESGHAQGLPHSTDPASIMYPTVPPGRRLTADAIAAAAALDIPTLCFSTATLPGKLAMDAAVALSDWNVALHLSRFSIAPDCSNAIHLGDLPAGCGLAACTIVSGASVQIILRATASWN